MERTYLVISLFAFILIHHSLKSLTYTQILLVFLTGMPWKVNGSELGGWTLDVGRYVG